MSYNTAGLSMTHVIGAYSALPMQFSKLLISAPSAVLENEIYALVAGTQIPDTYGYLDTKYFHRSLRKSDKERLLGKLQIWN
ncbi:hypothetical protein DSO57_1008503 [Entomophthora muscae]|uniref:Uncharacterized protein n=1 Tax=Entomophthora muscae TaxID=34485 RepID=A0ACC2TI96_9FUNG|nr:hypothetical protein DSO57_1008503 [Entomophthora muscae]